MSTENLTEQQVSETTTLLANLVSAAETRGLLHPIYLGDKVKLENVRSANVFANGKKRVRGLVLSNNSLFEQDYLVTIALGGIADPGEYDLEQVPVGMPKSVDTQDYTRVVLEYNVSRERVRYLISEIMS
jgi:hypothetical protein